MHGLHPYLGKYVPQLVEIFLARYFRPGQRVYDPFVGSGTTLVEANVFGADAVGCDISSFNCLLSRVKTMPYALGALELGLRAALAEARAGRSGAARRGQRVALGLVCAAGARRAPALPRGRLRASERPGLGRRPGRPLARGSLGAADDALRSRLSARAGGGRLLLPQAQADVPAGRAGGEVPRPLHGRHDPQDPRPSRSSEPAGRSRSSTRTPVRSSSPASTG